MVWKNLKDNKCPDCGFRLKLNEQYRVHNCTACKFRISEARFNEVVNSLYRRPVCRVIEEEDNQEALNNLSSEKVSDDFRYSPYLE